MPQNPKNTAAYIELPKYNYGLMLKNPAVYRKMVNRVNVKGVKSTTWTSGHMYELNRRKYISYLYRFVGEAIRDIKVHHDDLVDSTQKHIQYLNHNNEDYSSRAKLLINNIKQELKYKPWGIYDLSYTIEDLAEYAFTYYAFNKYTDFIVYHLLLINSNGQKPDAHGFIHIFKPSALYSSIGMKVETIKRSFRRLKDEQFIEIIQLKNSTISYRILKIPQVRKKDKNRVIALCNSVWLFELYDHDSSIDSWLFTHFINRKIVPGNSQSYVHPLLEHSIDQLQFTFGLTTLEEVLYATFTDNLSKMLPGLRKESPIHKLKSRANNNYNKMFSEFKYPQVSVNKKYTELLGNYRNIAVNAVRLGMPFNNYRAKLLSSLLWRKISSKKQQIIQISDPTIADQLQAKIGKLTDRVKGLDKYIGIANSGRVRSTWDIRGTLTNRTQTTYPNIQGMQKAIRYLLIDETHYALAFDISGFEIYIALVEAGEHFDLKSDLIGDISSIVGIDRKIIKSIIHPKTKGSGNKTIYDDLTDSKVMVDNAPITMLRIEDVIDVFYNKYPRIKQRYDSITNSALSTGLAGKVPYYDLNVISLVDERASTAGVAHVDQTIGSSLVKTWAVKYAATRCGKDYPIILDWHDNLTVQIPIGTANCDIHRVETRLNTCMQEVTDLFSYPSPPKIKIDDLTGEYSGSPSTSSVNALICSS